jgi:FlaA1/EpsC-like NDP-sugar epimerase
MLYAAAILFGVYNGSYRYAGVMEAMNIFFANCCVLVASLISCSALALDVRFAICFFGTLTLFMLVMRFLCRFLRYVVLFVPFSPPRSRVWNKANSIRVTCIKTHFMQEGEAK